MKKLVLIFAASLLFLSGCFPALMNPGRVAPRTNPYIDNYIAEDEKEVTVDQETGEKTIIYYIVNNRPVDTGEYYFCNRILSAPYYSRYYAPPPRPPHRGHDRPARHDRPAHKEPQSTKREYKQEKPKEEIKYPPPANLPQSAPSRNRNR